MSGPGRPASRLYELTRTLPDDIPVLEFQGFRTAARTHGVAVLPWRGTAIDAQASGVRIVPGPDQAGDGWRSALVEVQKGRAATETDLAQAWRRLVPGGHLHLLGPNDLGVTTYARRFGETVGQDPEKLATGGHGRLVRFVRSDHPGPVMPSLADVPGDDTPDAPPLTVLPGVFSGDGLDQGTAFLIRRLAGVANASRVLDLGCGAGHLAIAALRRWRSCRALLLDADARAVACATANCARLGLAERAEVRWWCERDEPPAATSCDLVLVNPPCHAGSELDLFKAEALLDIAGRTLRPGGRMLVVANRRLPYETILARIGTLAPVEERDAFKVIEVTRG